MADAADDAKRQRVGDAKEKPDDVEEAFNKVELYVSRYTDYAAGKFDEVKFSRWTPDSDDYDDDAPITEEELNLVAYAHPTIYFKELGSNGGLRDWPSGVKFDAPNGQDHFKVRDLVVAIARFGRCLWGEDTHACDEGISRVHGEAHTFTLDYGS